MRNPVWILNVCLTLVLFAILGILAFLRRPLPLRKSFTPLATNLLPKKPVTAINVSQIYDNDLFRTFIPPIPIATPEQAIDLSIPPLTGIKSTPTYQPVRPQFLSPLKITLKGIISLGNEKSDRAIIADEKTKKEDLYSVGDTIEDAEILRVDVNKVIFVRSNGQEETVFLNAQEAQADPIFSRTDSWSPIVQKISAYSYVIDEQLLKQRITNIAEFIDMLNMTSAIQNNTIIGCRLGIMDQTSIGPSLGLAYNDVVTSVNDMSVSTTKERVAVYQMLKNLRSGATIKITVERKSQPIELMYVLKAAENEVSVEESERSPANLPTLQDIPSELSSIKKHDRSAMRQFGGQSAWLQRTNQK